MKDTINNKIIDTTHAKPSRESESLEILNFPIHNETMELKLHEEFTKLMKQRNLTLKEVAKHSGVSISTLSEWSNGRKPRDPLQLTKVAKFLGVSLHRILFGYEDENHASNKIGIPAPASTGQRAVHRTYEVTIRRVLVPLRKE